MATYQELINTAINNKDTATMNNIIKASQTAPTGSPLYQAGQDAKNWMSAVGVYVPNTANQTNPINSQQPKTPTTTEQNTPQSSQSSVPGSISAQTPVNNMGNTSTPIGGVVKSNAQIPTETQTQPLAQPKAQPIQTTQSQPIGLRDSLTQQGYTVDYKNGIVYANGIPVDTNGLALQNGHYIGTQDQIQNAINKVGANYNPQTQQFAGNNYDKLRNVFEQEGHIVEFTPKTGLTIDGVAINTSGFPNINGSLYINQSDYNKIKNQLNNNGLTENSNSTVYDQYVNSSNLYSVLDTMKTQNKNLSNEVDQFKSQLSTAQVNLVNQLATNSKIINDAFSTGFTYDQNNDKALQKALQFAENKLKQTLIGRGMMYSTEGRDEYTNLLSEMIPQYEQIAYDRYVKNIGLQVQRAQVLGQFSQNTFEAIHTYANTMLNMDKTLNSDTIDTIKTTLNIANDAQTAYDNQMKTKLDQQSKQFNQAIDRTNLRGFVSNSDAVILGVKPGTLSATDRAKLEQQKFEIQQYQQKLEDDAKIRKENLQNDIYKAAVIQQNNIMLNGAESANEGLILASISHLSPSDQMKYIMQNKDAIKEKVGSKFPHMLDTINDLKQKSISNSNEQQRIGLSAQNFALDKEKFNFSKTEKQQKDNELQQEKSLGPKLSYSELDNLLKQTIENYKTSKNPYIYNEKTDKGTTEEDDKGSWQKPGSVEAQNLTDIVKLAGRGLIPDQQEALMRKYKIPIIGEK